PTAYALLQNYPNPFNYGTSIRFEVPVRSEVELAVYDILGRRIKTLFNGTVENSHICTWDGTAGGGLPAATGVYFARLKTPNNVLLIKMLLIK
ncbi:MAG: T9SS type A sorting domain-containing protein, partial [Bacteroidetes bacterium]|nr:T9SS type A sorting domain-containing protein [Bacteroidota bacterium]